MARISVEKAITKIARFCAYQERSQQEVRNRLYEYGLYHDEVEDIITRLITEGFLNEERFAISYAGGKFRIKKWGWIKILQGLKQHQISGYCIKKAFEVIDDEEYRQCLSQLLAKKSESLSDQDPYIKRQKMAQFVINKGYEPELVWQILENKS